MVSLSAASTLATIVGLVCNFKSGRDSSHQDDYNEFVRWIDSQRHIELVKELESNHDLSMAVQALLKDNHQQVIAKLEAIEVSMSAFAAHIGGLREISQALTSHQGISDQAFSIIVQLDNSGGSFFLESKTYSGTSYHIMDASGKVEIQEPRFVYDDLDQLCNLGLLKPDHNRKGERPYRLTRSAAQLVAAHEL